VLINPVIVQQPQTQLVMPAKSATFSVAITNATLPIGYQWVHAPSTVLTNMLLFSTNCSFTLLNVQASDGQGGYRVVVTNVAGTNNSSFASLSCSSTSAMSIFGVPGKRSLRQ